MMITLFRVKYKSIYCISRICINQKLTLTEGESGKAGQSEDSLLAQLAVLQDDSRV